MRHHLLQLSIFLLSLSPAAADRDPNYFPPLPDDVIPPILDEKIKASELLGYPPEVHSVTLEYPWRPSHDEQASREKHLSWQFQQDHAYCVHVDPAFREPGTSFAQFLGSECSDKLHKWQPKDSEYRQQCFNAGETADQEVDTGYAIYTRRELWANTEHCRAGCETCFDAMEEYGAREAYCARVYYNRSCQMAVLMDNQTRMWYDVDFPGRRIYYGDDSAKIQNDELKHQPEFHPGQTYYLPEWFDAQELYSFIQGIGPEH